MPTQSPQPPAPGREALDTIRHDVQARTDELHGSRGEDDFLSVSDRQDLFRVASYGVLRQLDEAGVKGAAGLSGKLAAAGDSDNFADLFTVADRLRQAEAMATELGDVNAQAEHHRLALLADAAGGTAAAVVSSVLSPEGTGPVAARGRNMLEEYQGGRSASAHAVHAVLKGLLDELHPAAGPEAGPEDGPRRESDAAPATGNVISLDAARRAKSQAPNTGPTPRLA